MHILHVEDNRGDAVLTAEILARAAGRYGIDTVENSRVANLGEALRAIEAARPDLILLDLDLPDAPGGLETLRRVREVAPDVAIVVLTGHDDDLVAEQAVREGAQDFLVKGRLEDDVVFRTLRYAVDRQQSALELRDARRAAESGDRWKTLFLASLSHELRTPLTVIVGNAELLERKLARVGGSYDELETLQRCAHHLEDMIRETLDLARLEAGEFSVTRSPCRPRRLVEQAVAMSRHAIEARGLELRFRIDRALDEELVTDPTVLRQIVLSLLENAIKYTESGWIGVSATRGGAQDGGSPAIEIEVEDTGIGMTPEQLGTLFQPFRRAADATQGGWGLGLSIVHKWVGLLEGKIVAHSRRGEGTRFTVRLPLERPRAASEKQLADPSGELRDARHAVLVLEEDRMVREMLQMMLTPVCRTVRVAASETEAIDALDAAAFDTLLVDIHLAQGDDAGLRERLRRAGFRGRVIALSALTSQDDEARCLDAGFDALLAKPFSSSDLYAALAKG